MEVKERPLEFQTGSKVKKLLMVVVEESRNIRSEKCSIVPCLFPVLGLTWGWGRGNSFSVVMATSLPRLHPVKQNIVFIITNKMTGCLGSGCIMPRIPNRGPGAFYKQILRVNHSECKVARE